MMLDQHLYRIGLCLTPNRPEYRRRLTYHPIVILIIYLIFIFQRIASIFIENPQTLLILCDIGHLLQFKFHYNFMLGLFGTFVLLSQLVFYLNYKGGIEPTFLTLFHAMSVHNPRSVFLIKKLVILTRRLFKWQRFNSEYIQPLMCFMVFIVPYLYFKTYLEVLLYGCPSALFLTLCGHHFMNILGYQYLYFYIVCKYLNLRLKNLNLKLSQMRFNNSLKQILHSFDAIYRDIHEYNSTYFSKFLFNIWLLFGLAIVTQLYITIFRPLLLPMKILLIYFLVLYFLIFLFTIMTAASINYHAKKTYVIINSVTLAIFGASHFNYTTMTKSLFKVSWKKYFSPFPPPKYFRD